MTDVSYEDRIKFFQGAISLAHYAQTGEKGEFTPTTVLETLEMLKMAAFLLFTYDARRAQEERDLTLQEFFALGEQQAIECYNRSKSHIDKIFCGATFHTREGEKT